MKKGMIVFKLTAELDQITEKVEKEDLLEAFMDILEAFGIEVTGEISIMDIETEEIPDGKE